MKETVLASGSSGLLKVQDNTDGIDKTVDLYIAVTTPTTIDSVPWSYSIDGVVSNTRIFSVVATAAWQHVSKVYVGAATDFIFHIDDTGTTELGGPTDLEIQQLLGAPSPSPTDPTAPPPPPKYVNINVGGVYKKAIPYVNVAGDWKVAIPMVQKNSQWTEVQ